MNKKERYSKISPTAIFCARMRNKYKIPFSKEIISLIDKKYFDYIEDLPDYGKTLKLKNKFVSFIEGRYYSLNKALGNIKNTLIVELASGLSPRSLEFLNKKKIKYLESDLKNVITLKESIFNEIIKEKNLNNKNVSFKKINPLKKEDLKKIGKFYLKNAADRRLVIIHEGLLMYLNSKEKRKLAKNIKSLFEKYSEEGIWLTPDFSRVKKRRGTPKGEENIRDKIKKVTQRNFNYFKSIKDAREFLAELGLKSEILSNKKIVLNLIRKKGFEDRKKEILDASSNFRVWKVTLN